MYDLFFKPPKLVFGKEQASPLAHLSLRDVSSLSLLRVNRGLRCKEATSSLGLSGDHISVYSFHSSSSTCLLGTVPDSREQPKEDRHSPCSLRVHVLLRESGSELHINRVISHNNKRYEESNCGRRSWKAPLGKSWELRPDEGRQLGKSLRQWNGNQGLTAQASKSCTIALTEHSQLLK